MRLDRDLHAVTRPPLGESKQVGALPPTSTMVLAVREHLHAACGSGAWTGDCSRLRAPQGFRPAGGCCRQQLGNWPREWIGVGWATRTRVQQLTPVSRSAALRPLAARVMKGADWEEARNRLRRPDGRLPAVHETTHVK